MQGIDLRLHWTWLGKRPHSNPTTKALEAQPTQFMSLVMSITLSLETSWCNHAVLNVAFSVSVLRA